MEYAYLGQTGVQVSRLCFGTMTFGNQADREASAALFKSALDHGINFFDCANVYGQGKAETILGELIRGVREDLVITTKVHNRMSDKVNDKGSSRRHIMLALEASLKRLGTDRVDIYFLHSTDANAPVEEALAAMDDLVRKGKTIYYGISNFSAWQTERAIRIAERNGWHLPKVIQPMYNLVKRQAEVEILPMARAEGLGVVTYSPLGGGMLTGKYLDPGNAQGRLVENDKYKQRYDNPRYAETTKKFAGFCNTNGHNPASLAVAWVMAHPAVTSPIIGARSVEQLAPSLEAVNVRMTDALYAELSGFSEAPPPPTDRSEIGA